MVPERAARPSRSHARPSTGRRARGAALVLGAVPVAAGAGVTLTTVGGEEGGRPDRVAAGATKDTTTGTASPGGFPSACPSAAPDVSASAAPGGTATAEATTARSRPARPAGTAGPATGPVPAKPSATATRGTGQDGATDTAEVPGATGDPGRRLRWGGGRGPGTGERGARGGRSRGGQRRRPADPPTTAA
jgi:hypothetical protein